MKVQIIFNTIYAGINLGGFCTYKENVGVCTKLTRAEILFFNILFIFVTLFISDWFTCILSSLESK